MPVHRDVLISWTCQCPAQLWLREQSSAQHSLQQEHPCSRCYKFALGAVSFQESPAEHLWTPSYSVISILVELNNSVARSVSIFSHDLVYQGRYLNVICLKVVDIKIKNLAFLNKCKFVIYATIILSTQG